MRRSELEQMQVLERGRSTRIKDYLAAIAARPAQLLRDRLLERPGRIRIILDRPPSAANSRARALDLGEAMNGDLHSAGHVRSAFTMLRFVAGTPCRRSRLGSR
jgi:hypothetical protein